MPEYKYVAKSPSGETINGSIQAQNQTGLARAIKEQGLYLVSFAEVLPRPSIVEELLAPKLSTKELGIFCRQIAAMLNAGVTLVRALDIFYQQTSAKTTKEIVRKLYEDVQRGDMLSDALRKQGHVFPPLMISIVEAGEASGSLDRSIERMATQFENDDKLRSKVISAMIYPSVLAVLAIGAVIVMMIVVLPTFVGIFEDSGAELPAPTKFIMASSDFLVAYWPALLAAIAALILFLMIYRRSESGGRVLDGLVLRIPVVKDAVSRIAASRFTRTMANLLASGLPLLSALEITARVVGNRIVGDKIIAVREEVRTGVAFSQATYKIEEFPPLVYSMISIGEESGSLSDLLDRVSGYLDDEVNSMIQRLLSLLEPALMVFMAGIIGFVVVAIMLPIFGVYGQIG